MSVLFFRMRSKGSRFTLGVWGLRVCSLDLAFTVAIARNCSREVAMAVPMASSAKGITLGGSKRRVAWLRFAWQAWHLMTFQPV